YRLHILARLCCVTVGATHFAEDEQALDRLCVIEGCWITSTPVTIGGQLEPGDDCWKEISDPKSLERGRKYVQMSCV
ncbi:MAG: hypothetical protein ACETWR_24860, partial [Anaerolineae bacterium]